MQHKVRLKTELPLGDCIVLTSAIYSLHKQFPRLFLTAVDTKHQELFLNNPHVVEADDSFNEMDVNYPSINRSNSVSYNFINGYVDDLAHQLRIPLKLQTNRPHLYLTDKEKDKYADMKPYWVVISGGKSDFTCKHLPKTYLQRVVDHFIGNVKFVQSVRKGDINYVLDNVKVLSDIDKREMLSLVYNSQGVIGPVTAWQHIAAAFEKPYICVAGGREPVQWISNYPYQQTLHTIGTMDCCKKACWKARVMPMTEQDKSLCEHPVYYNQQWVAGCLLKIKPEMIIKTMEMYDS